MAANSRRANQDTEQIAVIETITVGGNPNLVGINPATGHLYVVENNEQSVMVLDVATRATLARVRVGGRLTSVAVDPIANLIAFSEYGGNVLLLDGATNAFARTLQTGMVELSIAVDPSRGLVFAPSGVHKRLTILDEMGANVDTPLPVGGTALDAAVDPETGRLYVASFETDSVAVFGTDGGLEAKVPAGSGPAALAIDPTNHRVYVACALDHAITIFDSRNEQLVANLQVARRPVAIGVNPTTHHLFVVRNREDELSVYGASNGELVTTLQVGHLPVSIAVNPETSQIYVANNDDGTISVIQDHV
jgi:DNA-binding beta-propeller fold protein YncE